MKTIIRNLKVFAFFAVLLGSSQILAQTNTSSTQTVCAGSLAEPYLINPPTVGSTYQWTINSGGTITAGATTDNITVDWGVNPGTYTISVTETDSIGCIGNPRTVDVTVVPLPSAPTAGSQTACFGSTIPDLTATGTNLTWYDDVALTTVVGTGASYATGQTAVGIYTYYVTEATSSGCESSGTVTTLEIYALPSTGPINHW